MAIATTYLGNDGRFGNGVLALVDERGYEAGRVHGEELGRLGLVEIYHHFLEGDAELGEGNVDAMGDHFPWVSLRWQSGRAGSSGSLQGQPWFV